MSRRIEILKNITAELLNYLVVCSCAYIILADFAKRQMPLWLFVTGAAVPLFFYGLREWCDRLWLFLLAHGLPFLAFAGLYKGNIIDKTVMSAVIVLYIFLSVSKRIHSTGRGMEVVAPAAVAGVYLALYLLDYAQREGANGGLLLQLLICFVAGYYMFYYLRQFLSYVDINARTTENIPVKRVFFSSAALAAGFSVIAFCVITICANRSLIERVSAMLKAFLKSLLSLIKINSGEITAEPEVFEHQGGGGFPDLGEAAEPSLFMQIMDVMLTLAAFALILFFVVSGIIALKKLLEEGFAAKGFKNKITEAEFTDRIEHIGRTDDKDRKKKASLLEKWKKAVSPEKRIRRIYKKTILKNVPAWQGEKLEGLLYSATARECCLRIFTKQPECAEEFAVLYERARYGIGLCKPEDVSRMKKLSEELG